MSSSEKTTPPTDRSYRSTEPRTPKLNLHNHRSGIEVDRRSTPINAEISHQHPSPCSGGAEPEQHLHHQFQVREDEHEPSQTATQSRTTRTNQNSAGEARNTTQIRNWLRSPKTNKIRPRSEGKRKLNLEAKRGKKKKKTETKKRGKRKTKRKHSGTRTGGTTVAPPHHDLHLELEKFGY
ncbi:hypothetical protein QL285_092502 [Trifolium repens]|nr:hypothetical protein QL285_092502 [Trifolium repens]